MAQNTAPDTRQTATRSPEASRKIHRLRIFLVINLIILTIQGWFGDTVNIFVAPPGTNSTVPFSSLISTIASYGFLMIWHTFEGLLLVVLSFTLILASFRWSRKRSVRLTSILGALMIFSAAIGGVSFIL